MSSFFTSPSSFFTDFSLFIPTVALPMALHIWTYLAICGGIGRGTEDD
jgi:hypothetical protein